MDFLVVQMSNWLIVSWWMHNWNKIWNKIGLPSFIYGCELWTLNSTNLCEIERVQKYVAKSIQSLPIRTHDEIARGLIGWASMESIIDSRKLSYIGWIIRKPPGSVVKQVLVTRACNFITANAERKIQTKGFIPDVFEICKKYEMFEYIDIYLKGGTFLEKREWTGIISIMSNLPRKTFGYKICKWKMTAYWRHCQ